MGQAKQRGSRDERIAQAAKKPSETDRRTLPFGAMVTHITAQKEVAEFDNEIIERFDMHGGSMADVRAERMQIGIRNSRGEIYRSIGVTGMGEFLSLVQHLVDIGLVDELASATNARGGYDAIFSA
jgi:hypothetical protein